MDFDGTTPCACEPGCYHSVPGPLCPGPSKSGKGYALVDVDELERLRGIFPTLRAAWCAGKDDLDKHPEGCGHCPICLTIAQITADSPHDPNKPVKED